MFGHKLQGVMQTLREEWASPVPRASQRPSAYMAQLRERLDWAQKQAQGRLQLAQTKQKQLYDRTARYRQLQVGEWVLIRSYLFPKASSYEWHGSFPILKVCGPLTYEVRCGHRHRDTKKLHINLMQMWYAAEPDIHTVACSDH